MIVNQSLNIDGKYQKGNTRAEPMQNDKKRPKSAARELAYYSSIGLSVAFSIFIGLFIGVALDRYFDTTPIFTLIFLAFGVGAAFSNIIRAIRRSQDM